MKHDNNTYSEKVMLRQTAVSLLTETPVVMETHGGIGDLWAAVYADVEEGVVFEKRPDRTTLLALQRPTWAEGFDALHAVRAVGGEQFIVEGWRDALWLRRTFPIDPRHSDCARSISRRCGRPGRRWSRREQG